MANPRYLLIVAVALCMAVHAVVIGRYLGSVFFLTAFPWAWVGLAALRGDLMSARTMALTMIGVLTVSSVLLLSFGAQQSGLAATLSLAILPAAVSWVSVLFYIAHLSAGPVDTEAEYDAESVVTMKQQMTAPPAGSDGAFGRPAQEIQFAPLAAGVLTPETAVRIVGPIHSKRPASDAA